MSRKRKGINAERELIHLFWENGWAAVRVAGSGSMPHPCADIIAGSNGRIIVIECKTSKKQGIYIPKENVRKLGEFSRILGKEAWVGVKFNRFGWFFIRPDEMKDSGENLFLSVEMAKKQALVFEQLIGSTILSKQLNTRN